MTALKYAAGLVVVLLLHVAGVRLFDDFFRAVDLFLVVALFTSLRASPMAATFFGLTAGLVTDTFTGGLYGMYGFADTIVCYGAAFAAQRLVIQRPTAVWLVFAAGAAVQQCVVVGLAQLLIEDPLLPGFLPVVLKVGTTGLIGAGFFLAARRMKRSLGNWKKNRTSRLR